MYVEIKFFLFLKFSLDGNLLVSIPGFKDGPLLNFTDSTPLAINYVSFSSFGSTSARWFYDCPFDGYEKEIELEEHQMQSMDTLLAHLNKKAANETAPTNLTKVDLSFKLTALNYNQNNAILNSRMDLVLVSFEFF